jgi:hypothetical protein
VSPRLKALVRRFLKPVALILVLAGMTAIVVQNWAGISDGIARLDPAAVGGALVAVLVGLFAAMLSWRAVLTGMGSRLPIVAAARVYFLGQLGKYIPGSLWPIVAQAELSKEYGVPRTRSGVAALTQMMVSLVVGVVVAGVSLAASSGGALLTYWWLIFVVVGGVIALIPRVLNRLILIASRLVRRPVESVEQITGRAVLESAAWCVLMFAMFGAQVYLLARGIGASGEGLFLLTTGSYALAWSVGFALVILPAGAGAREAVLILVLAPLVARQDALAIALIARILMLAGDGLGAGAAVCGELLHRRLAKSDR